MKLIIEIILDKPDNDGKNINKALIDLNDVIHNLKFGYGVGISGGYSSVIRDSNFKRIYKKKEIKK